MSVKSLGYIGLGNIGKPAAKHLLGGDFDVSVYDIDAQAVSELVALGASASASIAELARSAKHIGVCVRDDDQVDAILYGGQGLLANCAAGSAIAIHSTVTLPALNRWHADAQAEGIHLFDAAISGGAQGAEAGTLCYMVGAESQVFEAAKPVFNTSADTVIHAGPVGSGLLLKLCNNMMTYASFMAMSEATRLAESGGLSAELLREVGKSNGVVSEAMFQFISNRNALSASCSADEMEAIFGPFGSLGEKDLDCALGSADEAGIDLPSTRALREKVYSLFMNKA
ncbi:MAG: NAD(P)-dependent oxidoreductase [Halieaceae bacterium]|nr:NAD(P)-dependent oxidoreductase [Halieaceae bacterium]